MCDQCASSLDHKYVSMDNLLNHKSSIDYDIKENQKRHIQIASILKHNLSNYFNYPLSKILKYDIEDIIFTQTLKENFHPNLLTALVFKHNVSDNSIIKVIQSIDFNPYPKLPVKLNNLSAIDFINYRSDGKVRFNVMLAICTNFPKSIMQLYDPYFREILFNYLIDNYGKKLKVDVVDDCGCTCVIVLLYRVKLGITSPNWRNEDYQRVILKLLDNFNYDELNLGQTNKDHKSARDYALELGFDRIVSKIDQLYSLK